jgi:hypothetical protein
MYGPKVKEWLSHPKKRRGKKWSFSVMILLRNEESVARSNCLTSKVARGPALFQTWLEAGVFI